MAKDAFETDVGGELRDRYGRPEYVLVPKHSAPTSSDVSRGYQAADADGRLQMVLQDRNGNDLSTLRAMATTYLTPSGGDDSATMAAALTSFVPFASPVVVLGPGTFLWNTQVPALLANTPAAVYGAGRDRTTIKLSNAAPRAFDLAPGGNATFQNIELRDFTVDANWIGGLHHIVIGTYQNGGTSSGVNINLLNISHYRLRVINALTDGNTPTNHRRCTLYYLSGTSTADQILFEDCDYQGGNAGFEVLGAASTVAIGTVRHVRCRHRLRAPLASSTCSAGATFTGSPQTITLASTAGFVATGGIVLAAPGGTATPIPVAYTAVVGNTLTGCTGSGVLPAGGVVAQWGQNPVFGPQTMWFGASNFQTGSFATVKHVTFYDSEGYYSGDVGSEVDNKDFALFDGCHFEDAFNTNNYFTNFTTPANPDVQTLIYRDHTSKRVAVANQFAGGCFRCDIHSAIPLGRVRFEGECLATNSTGNITTSDILNVNGAIQSIDLDGLRCIISNFTWSAGTIGHTAMQLSPTAVSGKAPNVKLGRMYVKLNGTVSGGTYSFDGILFTPNAMALDSEAPAFDLTVTGASAGTLRCVELNGSGGSPTMRGRLDGLQVLNMTGDGAPRAIMVRGTANITINRLLITECDFSGMSAGGNEIFYADTTNKPNVRAYSNVYKTEPAPTTWASFTTGNGFVQPFGWDAILQFAQGSGAGITAIDFSTNGGTTYTNFLTQASGALPAGFDQCLVLPGGGKGFLKITFATTQPTINVVPLNP